MSKLSRYIARQFTFKALALFIVAALLVWISQTLVLFDIITAKGQDIFALLGQSALSTPNLAMAIIYVCMGIGMAQVLRNMQQTRELHAIHSLNRLSAYWMAVMIFIIGGMIGVGFIANFLNPWALKASSNWNEEIAADLVGRSLNPNKFSEISPSLVVVIGSRLPDGTIVDFFADDRRNEKIHRTFTSKRAQVMFDNEGYTISLIDGSAQFMREKDQFSEIAFKRYEISLSKLKTANNNIARLKETDSFSIIAQGLKKEKFSNADWAELNARFSEILRIWALCLFVAAIAGYPHSKRKKTLLPLEAVVLALGMVERAFSSIVGKNLITGQYSGSLILLILAFLIIAKRQFFIKLPQNVRQVI